MKVIASAFKDNAELKKYAKKLMPFVQVAKVFKTKPRIMQNEVKKSCFQKRITKLEGKFSCAVDFENVSFLLIFINLVI